MKNDMLKLEKFCSYADAEARGFDFTFPLRFGNICLYAAVAMVLSAILWACFSHVERVVVGTGRLVTIKPTIVIHPFETAIVKSIDVKVGSAVNKGDRLAQLDLDFVDADIAQLLIKRSKLEALIARLSAEALSNTFFSEYNDGYWTTEKDIFDKRTKFYKSNINVYNAQLFKNDSELTANELEQKVLTEMVDVRKEIELMRNNLYINNFDSRASFLQARDAQLELYHDLLNVQNNHSVLLRNRQSIEAEKNKFINDWHKQIATELADAKGDLSTTLEQIAKQQKRKTQLTLISPDDAVILEIARCSVGSVVREAEPLFVLVPLGDDLEAEVDITAQDIGLVRVGDSVRIKFEAFEFQKHGVINGLVRTISEDSFVQGEDKKNIVYHVRILLDTNSKLDNVPSDFRFIPGMTVTSEIKIGERRVITYVLYPIIRALDESVREP
jgi:HlyD family secretion protein